jgi:MSHA biogenesis protein MshO
MSPLRARGVTLIELVVVIVVLGILAGIAAVIMVPAYEAYFASQRRAELADVADTALRRMLRDVRLSLPNSPRVRVDGMDQFLEFLLTKNGGRYRATNDDNGATTEDPLDFAADSAFDTLGALPAGADQQVQANDFVVIHNLGIPGANAYDVTAASPNIARISNFGGGALADEDRITLAASTTFPLESPGRRFFVVSGPVTYACTGVGTAGGNGTGLLRRWYAYPIELRLVAGVPSAPNALPAGGQEAILAANVSECAFTYSGNLTQLSRGLITIRLAITRANETVVLYQQAHVNNVP